MSEARRANQPAPSDRPGGGAGGEALPANQPAPAGFVPPTYPYDRLEPARAKAAALPGGAVDLSVGTPTDPPPAAVLAALADADRGGRLRGYPPSIGSAELRQAIQAWTASEFGVEVPADAIAACVGTKEFVATVPHYLHLRDPRRDTVLYPAVSYPTYEMGARLGGLRPVPVPLDAHWRLDLSRVEDDDAARALLLWVNTPGNPAGGLDDLAAAAAWGRARDIPVFSDECYAVFTWDGPPRTILDSRLDGVVAVHSLSKRSNLAGMRLGWYAGDLELVGYLREVRKHAGMMVPGPLQAAGAAALADEDHVEVQRGRYRERLARVRDILAAVGVDAPLPGGGFYLWAPAPGGDAWAWADQLAATGGVLISPGEFYGPEGAEYARLAMVAPMDRLDLVASRLGV